MRVRLVLFFYAALLSSAFAGASEECRQLAASPEEPGVSDGVPFEKVDAQKALPPCTSAAGSWFFATAADQFRLGRAYHAMKNYTEAARWYQKSADAGYAMAQNNLGALYLEGSGVEKNLAEGLAWIRKAADAGSARAQTTLGRHYSEGTGVGQDSAKANEYFRKSADQNDPWAQYYLAVAYYNGTGVSQDYKLAEKRFLKSADQDVPKAAYWLGVMHVNGSGVAKDPAAAANWFRKAVAAGESEVLADALLELGTLEWNGDGQPVNRPLGFQHMQRAAQLGNATAKQNLATMKDALDAEKQMDAYGKALGPFGEFLAKVAKHHAENGYYNEDASGKSQYDRDAEDVEADRKQHCKAEGEHERSDSSYHSYDYQCSDYEKSVYAPDPAR
jgi:uncharacterized protein